MKKYVFVIIAILSSFAFSSAQSVQDTLVVVPGGQGMYFYHVVTKEETLYSLSRTYSIEPQELAGFNRLTLKSQLRLFQLVKIPLNNQNFNQSTADVAGLVPLYHKVLKGETLYHISQTHGKVPDELLQKWNRLSGNGVKTGQYLIVGWLKVGSGGERAIPTNHIVDNSKPSASPGKPKEVISNRQVQVADDDRQQNVSPNAYSSNGSKNRIHSSNGNGNNVFLDEVIASENANRHIQHSDNNLNTEDNAFSVKLNTPKSASINPIVKKEEKPEEAGNPERRKEPVKKAHRVQPSKPAKEEPDSFDIMLNRVTEAPRRTSTSQTTGQIFNPATGQTTGSAPSQSSNGAEAAVTGPVTPVAGEFEQQFKQQTDNGANISSKKGAAGWFKSNIQPGSGKYYALCNDLSRGTIVKVINPLNGKSILVKILDVIPKGAENYNLIIKISDAAMTALGVAQSRFWCEIQYARQ